MEQILADDSSFILRFKVEFKRVSVIKDDSRSGRPKKPQPLMNNLMLSTIWFWMAGVLLSRKQLDLLALVLAHTVLREILGMSKLGPKNTDDKHPLWRNWIKLNTLFLSLSLSHSFSLCIFLASLLFNHLYSFSSLTIYTYYFNFNFDINLLSAQAEKG